MSWWIFGKKEETSMDNVKLAKVDEIPEISVEPVETPELVSEESNNIREIKSIMPTTSSSPNLEVAKKSEPFFVRVDKFSDARKNLSAIGDRLKDMEEVLAKIDEVKAKEDEEISSWKEEMKEIRSHLSNIDDSLFNKVQF